VVGALAYGPISRRMRLRPLINVSIGLATAGTLLYLGYRDAVSAAVIDTVAGATAIFTQIAFLDLAAKACPRRVEATFFALLMSVYNIGLGFSQWTGGYLYEWLGFTPLILISAGMTAAAWLLVPLVNVDRIEATARAAADGTAPPAA
jgi:predicted MFS family arabinose efflux permease